MEQPFSSHDKLILFDLMNPAPKQPNPTDSQEIVLWQAGKVPLCRPDFPAYL